MSELTNAIADVQMLEAARVLASQGDYKKAIAFYKEACIRLPNRADAHRELAVLLFHQSNTSWLPWQKKQLAKDAALAAGRAKQLGDMDGDCLFIVAEVGSILGMRSEAVPGILQEAFSRYETQMDQGVTVSAFYLATALHLARMNEVIGQPDTAIFYYGIVANVEELERSGRIRAGSVIPKQVQAARASVARLREVVS